MKSKTKYMFESKDDFALKVKSRFVECFSFFDLRMKDFILQILTKLSPPTDYDERQSFYKFI